jgi:heat shock protein HslJ
MKLLTFISASAFIFFSAFIMKKESTPKQSLYDTKWVLKKIYTGPDAEDVNTKAFIKFDKEKNSAGGSGGCNSFGSTTYIKGDKIGFKNIISTQMYCEGVQEIENSFFKGLEKVTRLEIKGKQLILYHDKDVLLGFESE